MKRLSVILSLFICLLILTACQSAQQEEELPPLRVEWTLWPGDYPMAIAAELDLFTKHGVAVEPILYETFSETMADISNDSIDAGFFVAGDLVLVATQADVKGVLVVDTSEGADQVVAVTDIASPADLAGATIGVDFGTFGELFVRQMLDQYDISPDDVNFSDIGPEGVPAAMPDSIQAGHTWDPHTAAALDNGFHIIFTSAETPGLIPDLLAFRASVLEERPDDVRAFIDAWMEAVTYWQENPEEGNAMIAKHTGLSIDEISAEGVKLMDLEDNQTFFTEGTDSSSIYFTTQLYIDFLVNTGSITNKPEVDDLLDDSFIR